MESLGQAAARLLARLERAAKAKERNAGRVEQSESTNVFPDATERRPAPDADSIGDDFTTPGRLCGGPGNARQGLVIRDSATPQALGREADRFPRPFASRPSGAQVAANDDRAHASALDIARRWLHSAHSADVAKLSRQ